MQIFSISPLVLKEKVIWTVADTLDETKHNDKDKAACGNIINIAYH